MFHPHKPVALLVTPDSLLTAALEPIFDSLGLRLQIVANGDAALALAGSLIEGSLVLLDLRLPNVANGQLIAALHEIHVQKRCALALIAEKACNTEDYDEWLMRLREGIIDDIVPRHADASAWYTHISTMQRAHRLARELEQLREAAHSQMQHDRLTGVFNRETMLSLLFRETDRVQRLRGHLCYLLLDIDDFGHWNSELGTDACDQLLQQVAVRTGRILRSYDLLGRLGKDEFLIALPGCSLINATMLAERLRMEIFGELFDISGQHGEPLQVRLTACFGVTSSRGRSPVVVLREAEQTLTRARLHGPDSIRSANESPAEVTPFRSEELAAS